MALRYVYSGAAGAANGTSWADAYTTLAAAATADAAGDTLYVAHDHAETQASAMTITSSGTDASPVAIYCVNRAGSVPPVSADLRTTATVSTTGANGITLNGVFYCYGLTFTAGSGASSANLNLASGGNDVQTFDLCAFKVGGSGGGNILLGAGFASTTNLYNTTLEFTATSQTVLIRNRFVWRGTVSALTGATFPTTLFSFSSGFGGVALIEGVDLSALGSGKTLCLTTGAQAIAGIIQLKDCKLGASVTVAATPSGRAVQNVDLVRCDSVDGNYRQERPRYEGAQTTETTIVRTGGASDGTTPLAWKIITTANSKRIMPFEALPISIWNETTGSAITLTVQGIWGGGAVPTNADIWMDVEYLGTSGFPAGSFASSGPADQLASGTNLSAGSGTWGGSTTKFALSKQITPQEKGPITVYIKAALASSTFYIDPKITVS